MPLLSVKESFRFAVETFKKRPWIFIQAQAIILGIYMLEGIIESPFETDEWGVASFVFSVIGVIISTLLAMGFVTFILNAHDGVESASIRDLWSPQPFLRYLGASLLTGIILLPAYLLLIVPGIFLSICFMFVPYLVMEKKLGPVAAMKESWAMTKGNRWKLLLLGLTYMGIVLLGALALLVGLLVAIPTAALMLAHAYRTLTRGHKELAELETKAV